MFTRKSTGSLESMTRKASSMDYLSWSALSDDLFARDSIRLCLSVSVSTLKSRIVAAWCQRHRRQIHPISRWKQQCGSCILQIFQAILPDNPHTGLTDIWIQRSDTTPVPFLNILTLFLNKPIALSHPHQTTRNSLPFPRSFCQVPACSRPFVCSWPPAMHKRTLGGLTKKIKETHFPQTIGTEKNCIRFSGAGSKGTTSAD